MPSLIVIIVLIFRDTYAYSQYGRHFVLISIESDGSGICKKEDNFRLYVWDRYLKSLVLKAQYSSPCVR